MRGGDRGPEGGSDRLEDTTPEDVKPRENPEERPENIDLDPETQKLRDDIQALLENPSEKPEEVPEKDSEGIELSPENKVLRDKIQDLLNQENPELRPIHVPEKKPLSDRIADELRKTRERITDMFNRIAAALLNESFTPQRNSRRNENPRPREMKPSVREPLEITTSQSNMMKIENINTLKTNSMEKMDNKPNLSKEDIKEKMKELKKLVDSHSQQNNKQKSLEKNQQSDKKNVIDIDEFKAENEKKNSSSNSTKKNYGMNVGDDRNEQKNEKSKEKEKSDQIIIKENEDPVKYPSGYLKKWENMEKELNRIIKNEYTKENGEIIKKAGEFPTQPELIKIQQRAIITAAHRHHGGISKVKEKIGFKFDRFPPNHWKKLENLEMAFNKEIKKEYKNEKGKVIKKKGEFPSPAMLRERKLGKLVTAAQRHHGGYAEIRKNMGYESDRAPHGHWKEWGNLERALNKEINKEYINENGETIKKEGEFPNIPMLKEMKKGNLIDAINIHGGFTEVRKNMGYESDKMAPNFWKEWENLEQALKIEINKEYKDRYGEVFKKTGEYPTEFDLRKMGEYGIIHSIQNHHGGFIEVRKNMGYTSERKEPGYWQKPENFFKEMEEAIKKNGGIFPSKEDLKNMNLQKLENPASKYYGGFNNIRQVMGYPPIDWSERIAYINRRGFISEQAVIDLMKDWMDLNGYSYSSKKQTKVAPGKQLECVCEHGKIVGIDVTNSKHPKSVEAKWNVKKYQKHVDQLWVVVVSNRFNEKQYKKWNDESPSNVIVIDYKDLGKFLNSMNSGEVKFNIPPKKKAQLDALAKCTYENREKTKREYEALKKQKKLDEYFED